MPETEKPSAPKNLWDLPIFAWALDEDTRDEVPYPEWLERDPETGELP